MGEHGRARILALALVAGHGLPACSSSDEAPPGPGSQSSSGCVECACPDGFERDPRGAACVDVLPEADCPAGTRPSLGNRECVPAGWDSACPQGFDPDPSGWGCRPVLPDEPCTGIGVDSLGSAACGEIACPGAFPPAGATIFVDDDFGPADLDATHFATIGAAVSAAPDGATVAIEAGTYVEAFHVQKPLTLIGRCAPDVLIQSEGGGDAGIDVENAGTVVVRGVTLDGHLGGLLVLGSEVTLEDSILANNRGGGAVALSGTLHVARSLVTSTLQEGGEQGIGVLAQGGSQVEIEDTAIVWNHVAGVIAIEAGTHVSLSQSVVRATQPGAASGRAGPIGRGAMALEDAALEMEECAFVDNVSANLSVRGAHAAVVGSVLRGALPGPDAFAGNGIEITEGGALEIHESAVVASAEAGIVVTGAGSSLSATAIVVRGPLAAGEGELGIGVVVDTAATADLSGAALVANRDSGLIVQQPGTHAKLAASVVADSARAQAAHASGVGVRVGFGGDLEMDDVAVVRNRMAGVLVGGATIGGGGSTKASRLVVLATGGDEAGSFGRGIDVWDASLELEASAIVGNRQGALVVGPSGSAVVTRTSLRATLPQDDGAFGDGLAAVGDAQIGVTDAWVLDNARVGLFFAGASAAVDGVVIAGNAIGIQAQDGSTLGEVDGAPGAPEPGQVLVSKTSQFVENQTRVGTGALAVPVLGR